MNPNPFGVRFVCALAVAVCTAVPAAAQEPDAGSSGNVFGGSSRPKTHTLDLSGGLFGGYDDTPLAQAPNSGESAALDPRFQQPGTTSGFSAVVAYRDGYTSHSRSGSHIGFGADASVQEFAGGSSKPLWSPKYDANTTLGTNLTPKISIGASAAVSYAPYYQYAPFLTNAASVGSVAAGDGSAAANTADPGGTAGVPAAPVTQPISTVSPVGTDAGFAAQSQFVTSLSAGTNIKDQLTKRTSVSASGGLEQMLVGQSRIENRSTGVQIAHKLTSKVGFHFGYGLQESRYVQQSAPSTQSLNHSMEFGVDYGDGGSISFARYYTLSFTTGLSAVNQGSETQFRLNGGVTLVRRIARTWAASIGAARGTSYVLGFSGPLYSDSANAGFGGQLAPRLSFSAGAGYWVGQRAFSNSGDSVVSKNASTRLSFSLIRQVSLYGQYSYYQYTVPAGFLSTVAFPPQQHRRSASVGLSFAVPLIHPRVTRNP